MRIQKFNIGDRVILMNGLKGEVKSLNTTHGENKNYYNVYVNYENAIYDMFAGDIRLDK
jgi:preprotein translocase subunit YajC